jgi:hypothetical protein
MTSSQPPQPPGGYGPPPQGGQPGYGQQPGFPPPGQQPPYGQQPGQPPYGPPPGQYPQGPPPGQPGQPAYGPPPGQPGQPAYGPPPGQPPYGPPPGYGQQPGYNPYGQPASAGGPGFSFDAGKLKMAHYVIAGGTLVYLVLSFLPWVSFDDLYYYSGSVSGWRFSGLVPFSFFLFLLATVWAALPAFYDLKLGFPRGWITVGLAGLGFLLTLIAWIDSLSWGFSIWALLSLIVALAIAAFAFLSLLPELRNRPALPGGLAGAAQWANQQAPGQPQFGGQQTGPGGPGGPAPHGAPQGGPQGGPGQPYGQPPQPAGPPPQQYPSPQFPPPPPTGPGAPGGSHSAPAGPPAGSGPGTPPPPPAPGGGSTGSTSSGQHPEGPSSGS